MSHLVYLFLVLDLVFSCICFLFPKHIIHWYPFIHLSEEQMWSTTQHNMIKWPVLNYPHFDPACDQIFNCNSKILLLLPSVIHIHFVHLTVKPHVCEQFFFMTNDLTTSMGEQIFSDKCAYLCAGYGFWTAEQQALLEGKPKSCTK